ncbi:hypothetical protein F7725_013735 [Dissostichus mawsoni]|uniref:Uncharacterized protein n=1 Tax=Dissostichus mawsoni TaxID=36200 RepID=A0A7J5YX17_DISMA|nr:hypothetical protein F7725_013735 [Dissostichus mawsoni]
MEEEEEEEDEINTSIGLPPAEGGAAVREAPLPQPVLQPQAAARHPEIRLLLWSKEEEEEEEEEVGEMASDLMNVAALGRPFTLGMLYDARKDELVPGLTLWDSETLHASITETSQHSSSFERSSSDSTESKSNMLDIEASLEASVLGGLIEVGGSAKYLNDQKKFKIRAE